jgi:hypothetical protein
MPIKKTSVITVKQACQKVENKLQRILNATALTGLTITVTSDGVFSIKGAYPTRSFGMADTLYGALTLPSFK